MGEEMKPAVETAPRKCEGWVKLRRTQHEHMFSALPSNSDIARRSRHVSKVPLPDSLTTRTNQSCAFMRWSTHDAVCCGLLWKVSRPDALRSDAACHFPVTFEKRIVALEVRIFRTPSLKLLMELQIFYFLQQNSQRSRYILVLD